jgi:hypothetical protein
MDLAQTIPIADTWGMHGVGVGWMVLMMFGMVLFLGRGHLRRHLAPPWRCARRVDAGRNARQGNPRRHPRASVRGGRDYRRGLPGSPGSPCQWDCRARWWPQDDPLTGP